MIRRENRTGRRSVLSEVEQNMLAQHTIDARKRGFAFRLEKSKSLMGRVAKDGRVNCYKTGVPSEATVRKFRADHRELTVRTARNMDLARIKAQSYAHVETYQEAVFPVIEKYPTLSCNPDLLWNMDEVGVSAERGTPLRF